MNNATSHPWASPADAVLEALAVDAEQGLDEAELVARQRLHGPNELGETARRGVWRILLDQFTSLITALLCVAGGTALAFGNTAEAVAIAAVVALNTAIGFFTELHAVRSMQALRELGQVPATVRRQGRLLRVDARSLVPGDILVLQAGDIVSADARLTRSSRLQADQSLLTGESAAVEKSPQALPGDTALVERSNMLFKGSALTRGYAEAVVVATGAQTEVGGIAALTAAASPGPTPLEQSLRRLGRRLVVLTGIVCVLVALVGLGSGQDVFLTIETAIALAVAAIPEGLPIVATIALARGMRGMARNNALIERLAAVETLGATNLIVTDKTGTLTANRMSLRRLLTADGEIRVNHEKPGEEYSRLLEVAALCNTAELRDGEDAVGDPTEVALLRAAQLAGMDVQTLRSQNPCLQHSAFDSDVKMMATVHPRDGHMLYCIKGATEPVLEACNRIWQGGAERKLDAKHKQTWLAHANTLGTEGLRNLAFAYKLEDKEDNHPYHDLVLLGIAGLADPPHRGIAEDMQACHRAGIRVVMVTGDQLETAAAIAREIGLVPGGRDIRCLDARGIQSAEEGKGRLQSADVIARANPRLKLELIDMYQDRGQVVAMTGDGINDAPALRKADIGVAMGKRGTQVAREAAAMVLEDDEFTTIINAVAQGRIIYANIRKFVGYLLSCNLSEILIIGLATVAGAAPPLLPLQILFLNLVTDVFPALALGTCGAEPGIMRKPPRHPGEALITRHHWTRIVAHSMLITLAVLGGVEIAAHWPGLEDSHPLTLAFLILTFSQLWHVFNMRADHDRFFSNEITRNPWVWAATSLCVGIVALALALPALRSVLALAVPDLKAWTLIIAASLFPVVAGPLVIRLAPGPNGGASQQDSTPNRT